MRSVLLAFIIRTRFFLTSRGYASHMIEEEAERTTRRLQAIAEELWSCPAEVPPMVGVDEDMRKWSPLMILEHNTIVNQSILEIVTGLKRDGCFETDFDPKHDVMPPPDLGGEAVHRFQESVIKYLAAVSELESLRTKGRYEHPIFGDFNAHQWHCMFGFHLLLHRRQMDAIVKTYKSPVLS